LIKKFF